MLNIYEQVDRNKRKSSLVVFFFILFITAAVYLMVQAFGYDLSLVGVAFVISGLTSLGSYYYSDKIILKISGAKPANRQEHFDFYTVAENLAIGAGMPKPRLYVINDTAMNAFATGRDPDHGVVVATTGLLSRLNRTELEGVIAHELAHIRNYDIRLMSIVTVLVGLVALLADWMLRMSFWGGRGRSNNKNSGQIGAIIAVAGIFMALLSPIIANLIKLAISRRREFLADASAAALTKYPLGLASALEKLGGDTEPLEAANKATAHLYIVNPLKNHHDAVGWFSGLFSTHPPINERIQALRQGV